MLKHWKRTLALLTVVAATGLVCGGLALGGKKPPAPPPPPPQPTISYSITFLGTLPRDVRSYAYDVNNSGEVVGRSYSADGRERAFVIVPEDTDGDGFPDLWYRDTEPADGFNDLTVALNDLIDPTTGWDLFAVRAINDAGQIVGTGRLGGHWRAYRFTPGSTDEYGAIEDLGTLGGNSSVGYSINDSGEVAGNSDDANVVGRAFVWTEPGPMVDIGDLYGGNTSAQSINNPGQVTGQTRIPGGTGRAFLYTPGVGMKDLGDFGTDPNRRADACSWDINDENQVVGYAGNAPKIKGRLCYHAFLYTDTDGLKDLGTLGGWDSEARGINSSGEVVGTAQETIKAPPGLEPNHGFLYTNNTDTGGFVMAKLEGLIVVLPPDYQGPISAEKINDLGQICGTADGQAILLTPLP